MSEEHKTLKLLGCIWHKEEPDRILWSSEIDGVFCNVEIPAYSEAIREQARVAGKPIGKLVDTINDQMRHDQDIITWRNPGSFSSSVTWELGEEEARALAGLFGMDYEPSSPNQRADEVDGVA